MPDKILLLSPPACSRCTKFYPTLLLILKMAQETVDPVSVAQLLNDRNQIIEKLGSGRYSTVWLAKNQM